MVLAIGKPKGATYRMANFLGAIMNTPVGIKMKLVTNIPRAARISPPKTSMRSHRLTKIGGSASAVVY